MTLMLRLCLSLVWGWGLGKIGGKGEIALLAAAAPASAAAAARLLLLLLLEVPRPARAARGGLENGRGGERNVLFSTSFKYRNGKKHCILFHLVSVGNIKAKEDSVVYKV